MSVFPETERETLSGKANEHAIIFEMGSYDSRFDGLKTRSFDPAALWDRVAGDVELLRDLVSIFSEEYPRLLHDISSAIEQQSFSDLQRFSHKLKGSLLQFSGRGAAKLAASLEEMGGKRALEDAPRVFTELRQKTADLMRFLKSMTDERPVE